MKKVLTISMFCFTLTAFAQEDLSQENEVYDGDIAKNELSINAFNMVAFGALDVAYERIISTHSSWAVEGFALVLNRENEDLTEIRNASLSGKYKFFFGNRIASGFYVNALGMLSSGNYTYWDDYNYYEEEYRAPEEKTYTDFALGFGIGGKFVSKQGFFLDLGTGIGRNLFNNNAPTIVGHLNVNLGMRF